MFDRVDAPVYDKYDYERILVSDYTQGVETASRLTDYKVISYKFFCPRCKKEMPKPKHSKAVRCKHCALNMQAYGNALYIWENSIRALVSGKIGRKT